MYVMIYMAINAVCFFVGYSVGIWYSSYVFEYLPSLFRSLVFNIILMSVVFVFIDKAEIRYIWRGMSNVFWVNELSWFKPPISLGFSCGFLIAIIASNSFLN